ncbi:MAG TPA: tRNA 2-thiouridine(34) synthase MnmA [Spirochaetota bacterium]|nr:MAG: tRNA-specific 2-thiouridylase MnmA [Spirochaetes bacterium ADurb.Bin133]HNZ28190.1 tRNA 2-thiouridine(34) synthase MnmA [Spirochaetota bacterium]HOF01047.1 tRNA 2-thiouridine(34) synthase MnmA [Spirochaetota bacterium]HOS33762.1 tRNA 2-thiouridine(34) synthase MnmA [Spirochaetota bacterium]HOS56798.1 tRNA 2-thiouridine(34) synthase MnmA [Spirochaetota bacterium]
MKKKVLIGLSGGVDSSVAADILVNSGCEITAVTMKIYDEKKYPNLVKTAGAKSGCFGGDDKKDLIDAENVAKRYNIPFHIIDLSSYYQENILKYFQDEYLAGRTPNPCIKCNQKVKFGLLLEESLKLGVEFDCFATGHYARVEYDDNIGRYLLKKALFVEKDQSYFLSFLSQKQLSQILLPLGGYTKPEVRALARSIGLFTMDKEESQDFYEGDYRDLIERGVKRGNIVDTDGKILGTHDGIVNFTIGQRRGLGVSSNAPLYVVKLDKDTNEVTVDYEKGLFQDNMIVRDLNWISIENLKEPIKAKVRIRYRHTESGATIYPEEDGSIKVRFDNPQKAITPGQAAVIYDGDVVVGAGFIE